VYAEWFWSANGGAGNERQGSGRIFTYSEVIVGPEPLQALP